MERVLRHCAVAVAEQHFTFTISAVAAAAVAATAQNTNNKILMKEQVIAGQTEKLSKRPARAMNRAVEAKATAIWRLSQRNSIYIQYIIKYISTYNAMQVRSVFTLT